MSNILPIFLLRRDGSIRRLLPIVTQLPRGRELELFPDLSDYKPMMLTLCYWFSNFSMHQNHLEGSLQHRFLNSIPRTTELETLCVWPNNVHFQQVPRQCSCCWFEEHSLTTSDVEEKNTHEGRKHQVSLLVPTQWAGIWQNSSPWTGISLEQYERNDRLLKLGFRYKVLVIKPGVWGGDEVSGIKKE